jgi:hypothetical protein
MKPFFFDNWYSDGVVTWVPKRGDGCVTCVWRLFRCPWWLTDPYPHVCHNTLMWCSQEVIDYVYWSSTPPLRDYLIINRVPHGAVSFCPLVYTFYSRSWTSTYKFWLTGGMICSPVWSHVYVETQELNPRSSIYDQRKIPLYLFTIGFQKPGICALDSRNQESAQIPGFWNPMVKRWHGIFLWSRPDLSYYCVSPEATRVFLDRSSVCGDVCLCSKTT